jgi:integrase
MEFVEPIRDKRKIEAMKKVLKGSNLRDHCLFVLGINSGLRISDLLALTVGDVTTVRGKVVERIRIREHKTGKTKDFPVGGNARKAIEEYMPTRLKCTPEEPLFPSRKGFRPLQRVQAWKVLNRAAQAVGIQEKIGTHTLRKTFGYWAYKQGKDITLLQKLLNHHSPSVTLRYIGITQDEMDDVYLAINL